jgi:large subunit ribosomal protein L21
VAKKMIAVIHTGGKQYLVSPGQKIKIEKLETEVGKKVDFEKVLLFEDEKGNLSLGTPFLKDVKVTGKVLETGLGEKVRVFKYKPKTRYKVKKGHRQPYTEVEIEKITTK